MLGRAILAPRVLADGRASGILCVKASPAVKLLQFTSNARFEGFAIPHQKLGELEARGTGGEKKKRGAHVTPPLAPCSRRVLSRLPRRQGMIRRGDPPANWGPV